MPTRRVPLHRPRRRISQAAVDAWQRGDVWAVHHALGLAPWEYSPVPLAWGAYGLPSEPSTHQGTALEQSWAKIRKLQLELYALAGEPGVMADED
jgi:hypothetical protein